MPKIYVYGDSYVASNEYEVGWVTRLAEKLNKTVVNKGISGSSTEYAIEEFTNDVELSAFLDGDIIIFCTSTPGRLNLMYQRTNPGTGSRFLHNGPDSLEETRWFYKNRRGLQWYIANRNLREAAINHESYIHLLKSFADNNPTIKIILLSNSDHMCHIPLKIHNSNFIRPDIYLNTISSNEIIGRLSYDEWTSSGLRFIDPRINHLSTKNQSILIDLMIEALSTGNTSGFTYDKFLSDIFEPISSKEQYLSYIHQGLITPLDTFLRFFKIKRNEL